MRQLLTCNITLSHLCYHLKLYRHLRVGESYMISTRIITQNLAADLFEAYVGALHQDSEARGRPEVVGEWLGKVWSREVLPGLEHWAEAKHVGQKTGDKQHQASQVHKVSAGQTKGNQRTGDEAPQGDRSSVKPYGYTRFRQGKPKERMRRTRAKERMRRSGRQL